MYVIDRILHVLARYRTFRVGLADLGRRSDAQLAAIGIDRGDVVRIAYERAECLPAPEGGGARPAPTWPPTVATTAG